MEETVEETETGVETEGVETEGVEVVETERERTSELEIFGRGARETDNGFGRKDCGLGLEALGDISQRLSLGEGELTLGLRLRKLLDDEAVPCELPQGTADGRTKREDD